MTKLNLIANKFKNSLHNYDTSGKRKKSTNMKTIREQMQIATTTTTTTTTKNKESETKLKNLRNDDQRNT